jgi:hypothetical protein
MYDKLNTKHQENRIKLSQFSSRNPLNSDELANSASPKRTKSTIDFSRNQNATDKIGILKARNTPNESQFNSHPVDKAALLDNWMKVELDKYKENQALTSILETKKSSKASIYVSKVSSKDNITPNNLEKEKPLTNSTTAPTFS